MLSALTRQIAGQTRHHPLRPFTARSRPGTLSLPEVAVTTKPGQESGDRSQVLLVEDEEALRVGLRDKLEIEGFRVDATSNGEDALSRIKVKDYDIVLLDVVLPGMSGLEVLRRLREKEAKDGGGRRVPVILLTARAHESDKVLGLELGADDYMTKPFGVRELIARLRAHLRRERAHKEDESAPAPPAPPGYRFGECEVDFLGY